MKINPSAAVWIGVLVLIEQAIGIGTVSLTNAIPDLYIPSVKSWCLILAFIGTAVLTGLHAISPAIPGPLASPPTLPEAQRLMEIARKAAMVLFAIGLVLAATPTRAADVPTPPHRPAEVPAPNLGLGIICDPLNLLPGCRQQNSPTGPINIQDLWQRIIGASGPDLKYAKALADAANTQGSLIRSACYGALIAANDQSSGVLLKNPDGTPMVRPDPHLLTDVEQLGQVIDNLSPTGPVFSGCAAAAQAAKMNVLVFIGTIITGASGLAALGVT